VTTTMMMICAYFIVPVCVCVCVCVCAVSEVN
jgi:hypothetical protein